MAILGVHIVVSLIALTVLSKFGSRVSIVSLLVSGLIRYIAPSNHDLRALLPSAKADTRPRKRRQQRDFEESNGFNVPRQAPFDLKVSFVRIEELERFPLYSSIHWLTLFIPVCCVVVILSEVYIHLQPESQDMNASIIWQLVGVGFALQVLAHLTALLLRGDEEKSLLLSISILCFFALFVLTVFVDRLFDVSLLDAYTHLTTHAARLIDDKVEVKPYSPLLLYISIVMLFTTIGAGLIFPSMRWGSMYLQAVEGSPPLTRLLLHAQFLLPAVIVALFTSPIKQYLTEGRVQYITPSKLDILRIYLTFGWVFLRLVLFRPLLQAHLDLAYVKILALQKQTGKIRNTELQSLIFRYYSYLCAAIAQYLAPTVLILLLACLLKTTSDLTWTGQPSPSPSTPVAESSSISSVIDASICKAVFSFSLLAVTATNSALSMVGVLYHRLIVRAMGEVCMYGVEVEARALAPVTASEDSVSFLVGTQHVKALNNVCKVHLEGTRIVARDLPHAVGEVRALASDPKEATRLSTTSSDYTKQSPAHSLNIFRISADEEKLESIHSVVLEHEVNSLDWEREGSSIVLLEGGKIRVRQIDSQCEYGVVVSGVRSPFESSWEWAVGGSGSVARWSPHHGGNVLGAAVERNLLTLDVRTNGEGQRIREAHNLRCLFVDFNPNLQHVTASSGRDGQVRIWDWRKCDAPLLSIRPHAHWANEVHFHSVHDQLLLSCGSDASLVLTSVQSLSSDSMEPREEDEEEAATLPDGLLERIDEHEDSIFAAAWSSADPWTFASLSYDGRILISHVKREHKYALLRL